MSLLNILSIIFIVLLSLLGGVIIADYLTEGLEQEYYKADLECRSLCYSYDVRFSSYERGFGHSDECWCRTFENKPMRVS